MAAFTLRRTLFCAVLTVVGVRVPFFAAVCIAFLLVSDFHSVKRFLSFSVRVLQFIQRYEHLFKIACCIQRHVHFVLWFVSMGLDKFLDHFLQPFRCCP
jgi:hypothetical protein